MVSLPDILQRYKWTTFIILGLVFVLLAFVHAYILRFDCAILFSSCYHSWLELPLLLMIGSWSLILLFSALILGHNYPTLNKVLPLLNFIVGLIVFLATVFYHLNYNGHPQKQVFFDYEPVTPFHLQLSDIFFSYTLLLNFILLFLSGSGIVRVLSALLPPSALLIIHIFLK